MGRHFLLLSLHVAHRYFSDGRCAGLKWVPTSATSRLLQQGGLLIKDAGNGFRIFYDEDHIDALRLYASDTKDPWCFRFKVFSQDPYFQNYTEPTIFRDDAILYFDNRDIKKTKAGCRLHVQDYVSEENFLSFDASQIEGMLLKRDRLAKPHFLVSLWPAGAKGRLVEKNQTVTPKHYYLAFRAREIYWTYYVLANVSIGMPVIADLDQKTHFEFAGDTTLPNNQKAHTFRSTTPIPLQEFYSYRFQLRDSGNGKIFIKRLPVASPEQLARATIGGREQFVSDIYVNC